MYICIRLKKTYNGRLSDRLASLIGIMEAQLRAPLKPSNTIECCDMARAVSGGILNWEHMSFGQLYV